MYDNVEDIWTSYLMSGSLWSLMTFMVTSEARLNTPSNAMGPMADTMFCVSLKGTLSGQSNVSPYSGEAKPYMYFTLQYY